MNIAKPPDGFKIKSTLEVKAKADYFSSQYLGFNDQWVGLKARIKMVGHRGTPVPASGAPGNYFAAEIESTDPARCPEFWVIYKILGDTLTICDLRLALAP
jgi:hypothetical protein